MPEAWDSTRTLPRPLQALAEGHGARFTAQGDEGRSAGSLYAARSHRGIRVLDVDGIHNEDEGKATDLRSLRLRRREASAPMGVRASHRPDSRRTGTRPHVSTNKLRQPGAPRTCDAVCQYGACHTISQEADALPAGTRLRGRQRSVQLPGTPDLPYLYPTALSELPRSQARRGGLGYPYA